MAAREVEEKELSRYSYGGVQRLSSQDSRGPDRGDTPLQAWRCHSGRSVELRSRATFESEAIMKFLIYDDSKVV